MTIEEAIKDIEECIKPSVGGKSLEIALGLMKHHNEMEKDRDRFYKLYHGLSKEYKDYRTSAEKRVNQLLKDRRTMMNIVIEKMEYIEKLEKELSMYKD